MIYGVDDDSGDNAENDDGESGNYDDDGENFDEPLILAQRYSFTNVKFDAFTYLRLVCRGTAHLKNPIFL